MWHSVCLIKGGSLFSGLHQQEVDHMTVSQQTWRLVCLSCVAVMKSATSVCLWDSLKPVGNNEEVQDSEPNKNQKRKKEDFYMTHSVLV